MSNLAHVIESLPVDYQREAEHYVQYLKLRSDREREKILARLRVADEQRAAGEVYSDAELTAYFDAKYGPRPQE